MEQLVCREISIARRASFTTSTGWLSIFQERHPRFSLAGAGSAHSALSIFRHALAGIIRSRTKLHRWSWRTERGRAMPRLSCTTSRRDIPHTTLKWSCVRSATLPRMRTTGPAMLIRIIALREPPFPASFAAAIAHHVCGQGRNSSYIISFHDNVRVKLLYLIIINVEIKKLKAN